MKTKIKISLLATTSLFFAETMANAQQTTDYITKFDSSPPTIKNSGLYQHPSTNNIGFGTTSPAYPFTVLNNINAGALSSGDYFNVSLSNGKALIGSQSAKDDAIFGTAEPNTGILFVTDSGTSFNERMRITYAGNVGIGTYTPSSILHTVASGAKTAAYSGNFLTNTATSSTASIVKAGLEVKSTGTWNGTSASNIGLYVSSVTGGANNYDAIFNGGGNVGIGTTAPTYKLEINDVNKTVLDLYRYNNFAINTTDAFAIDKGGAMSFGGTYFTGSPTIYGFAAIKGAKEDATSGLINGYLSFMTSVAGTGSVERVRISSAGNVGIGTTSPDITVNGSAYKTLSVLGPNTSAYSCGILELATKSTDADANIAGVVNFTASANASTKKSIAQITAWTQGSTSTNRGGFMGFTTKPDGSTSTVERMRITNAGDIGIGTTAPGYKLDVTGDIHNTGVMAVGMAPSGTYALTINGSGLASGGSWVSDQLFKTNTDSLQNALTIIHQLKPKSFYFDTTNVYGLKFPPNKQYGFIAQDLEQVLPELVSPTTKNADVDTSGNIIHPAITFKTVNYNAFWGILTKGIQEQSHEIDSLKTKTINQDSVNTAQSNKIDSLTQGLLAGKTKANNQDSIITSLQNQLNQLTSLISDCCNNNGNNGNHGNNLMPSGTNNYKSLLPTTFTDVELNNKNIVVLNQNVPNPFAEQTTISYYLPDNITRAQIIFTEQSGKIIKAIDLTEKGKGQLNVFANDLTNGIYTYSLIVDGQTMETKKMIKAK